MASLHTPPPSTTKERLHLNSILSLISLVNQHIQQFLSNPLARKFLHLHYTSNLTNTTNAGSCELSDHSVLCNLYWGIKNLELAIQSKNPDCNLYWGIKNLELAIQSKNPDDKAARLAHSEKMLQVPALLDEDGTMSGIANRYIVCSTYFHLCLVSKLRDDEWQMTMYFLQSVLASPGAVKMEFTPELWRSLFGLQTTDEAARQRARRYKDWLMYYQEFWELQTFEFSSAKAQVDNTPSGNGDFDTEINQSFDMRCLQDMLEESQSDSHTDSESSISDAPRWTTQADTSCQLPGQCIKEKCT